MYLTRATEEILLFGCVFILFSHVKSDIWQQFIDLQILKLS